MSDAQETVSTVRAPARPFPRWLPLAGLAAAMLALPYLGVPPFQRILLAYGLVMGIAALGLNLLLGYTGLLSFGHSAYFGSAAYASGLMIKYWGVTSMEVLIAAGLLANLALTTIFGFVCVRYTRIFFSILTLALSQVLWGLAIKLFWITGGTDGLRIPTPTLLGGLVGARDKLTFLSFTYYYYVLVVFFIAAAVMWVIVKSPFGMALQAVRDNETRAAFVGIRVRRYRWTAFVLSGLFAGLAGTLWAPLNGLVTPEALYWPFSGEMVFMTVLGGFKSFAGPILGAMVFNYLRSYAVGLTVYWQALLGVTLVVLVLIMPTGIIGTAARLGRRSREAV